jgi:hypothetical protein
MQNRALTEQESTWVADLAGRLRLIQADTASSAPEKRREYLHEEIVRGLKGVPPADRKQRLEGLLTQFPVAGKIGASMPAPAPAPAARPAPETPEQIFERFISAASGLSEAQRSAFSKKLYDAGFAWVDQDALVMEVSDELRQKLGLQQGQQPRLARVMQLALSLTDALDHLDQAALATMQEIAPKSQHGKRRQSFRTAAVRFLTAEEEAEPIEPYLKVISALLIALLKASARGGKEFGKRFIEGLAPTGIEDVIEGEGKKGMGILGPSKMERCWERYKLLYDRDYKTADLVERRIKEAFAAFIEKDIATGR